MKKDTDLYRPNMGVMVINNKGLVLMCRRSDLKDDQQYCWQMVQGGIDEGEKPAQAGYRELEEETGIKKHEVEEIELWNEFLYYDFPLKIHSPYKEYIGQKQKWLVVKYLKNDDSINLNSAAHNEFVEYKWVRMEEALNLIWPPKKHIYEKLYSRYQTILA